MEKEIEPGRKMDAYKLDKIIPRTVENATSGAREMIASNLRAYDAINWALREFQSLKPDVNWFVDSQSDPDSPNHSELVMYLGVGEKWKSPEEEVVIETRLNEKLDSAFECSKWDIPFSVVLTSHVRR